MQLVFNSFFGEQEATNNKRGIKLRSNRFIKKEGFIPSNLEQLSIRFIYSSGIKLGTPSAEATATHITAEELPLFDIV